MFLGPDGAGTASINKPCQQVKTWPCGFNSRHMKFSQRIFIRIWSSIFTEDRNIVNKTMGKERFHLFRNATVFDQIYRQLFKLLSAAWDRTTGAWVWAWLDPAVIKSGFGPRRPTAETQFNIAALSFRQHLICHMLCSSLSSSTYSTRPHPNAVFA